MERASCWRRKAAQWKKDPGQSHPPAFFTPHTHSQMASSHLTPTPPLPPVFIFTPTPTHLPPPTPTAVPPPGFTPTQFLDDFANPFSKSSGGLLKEEEEEDAEEEKHTEGRRRRRRRRRWRRKKRKKGKNFSNRVVRFDGYE